MARRDPRNGGPKSKPSSSIAAQFKNPKWKPLPCSEERSLLLLAFLQRASSLKNDNLQHLARQRVKLKNAADRIAISSSNPAAYEHYPRGFCRGRNPRWAHGRENRASLGCCQSDADSRFRQEYDPRRQNRWPA